MEVSICSEATINDAQRARERGGVWLTVEHDHRCHLCYLEPERLIDWIEGRPIGELATFAGLCEEDCRRAYQLLEEMLHNVVQCPNHTPHP